MKPNIRYAAIIAILLLMPLFTGLAARTAPSPERAMLYSLLLPGGGQLYNHAWLKAGLVMGVQGYLIGSAIHHDARRDDYQDLLDSATDPILIQQYRLQRDDFKARLTNDYWWMGITAALSMVDAYVDAHLWDFEDSRQRLHILFEDSELKLRLKF